MKRGRKEAEILEKTYRDRLTVCRSSLRTDPETRESMTVWEPVYEGIPCALSRASDSKPDRQEFHAEASWEMAIFTAPGVELVDNDRAEVETEAGQRFYGITGRTFGYVSHGETPFAAEQIT